MKSFIDLTNMAKGLMDKNHQLSVQQDLEKLFHSTGGGARADESRGLHRDRVGAGESSAATATDTNTSFATLSTIKQKIAEISGSKTCGNSQ